MSGPTFLFSRQNVWPHVLHLRQLQQLCPTLSLKRAKDKTEASAAYGCRTFPSCRTWTSTHVQGTSSRFASQQSQEHEPHNQRWELPPPLLLTVGPDLRCWQWPIVQKLLFEQRGKTTPSLTSHTVPTELTQPNTTVLGDEVTEKDRKGWRFL